MAPKENWRLVKAMEDGVVCSSRAGRKNAKTQVEPPRDCCVKAQGFYAILTRGGKSRNLSGTASVIDEPHPSQSYLLWDGCAFSSRKGLGKNMTELDQKILQMARRIRELREIEGKTPEEMAQGTDTSLQEYLDCENGKQDLNFAFIYRCATLLGVNVTDIIEGYSPKLRSYTVTRNGDGQGALGAILANDLAERNVLMLIFFGIFYNLF